MKGGNRRRYAWVHLCEQKDAAVVKSKPTEASPSLGEVTVIGEAYLKVAIYCT
jgi:hypothetical protein